MGTWLEKGGRPAASISFGLGSFMLMGDMALAVLRNGDEGGTVFDMGFPSPLGVLGLFLWAVGVVLLVVLRTRKVEERSTSAHAVFLRGRDGFTCRSCKRYNTVVTGEYLKRFRCGCGAQYDLFQDGPWDEGRPRARNGDARAVKRRTVNGRAPNGRPPRPSR